MLSIRIIEEPPDPDAGEGSKVDLWALLFIWAVLVLMLWTVPYCAKRQVPQPIQPKAPEYVGQHHLVRTSQAVAATACA